MRIYKIIFVKHNINTKRNRNNALLDFQQRKEVLVFNVLNG